MLVLSLGAPAATAAKTAPAEAAAPAPIGTEFRLGVTDVLDVMVWKEAELSRTGLMIRPDGMISLPLLGDIRASGKTPMELSSEIEEKLKEFLSNPTVTVLIQQINSYTIYVLGQVARPGMFKFQAPTRLMEAIVQAGGFGQFADASNVRVFREVEGRKQRMIEIDTKKIVSGQRLEDNLMLQPGDMVYVP